MQTKALIATPFISLLAAGSLFFGGDSEPTTFAGQAYDGVPPYQETEHYVEVITSRYDDLKSTSLALQTDIARS